MEEIKIRCPKCNSEELFYDLEKSLGSSDAKNIAEIKMGDSARAIRSFLVCTKCGYGFEDLSSFKLNNNNMGNRKLKIFIIVLFLWVLPIIALILFPVITRP